MHVQGNCTTPPPPLATLGLTGPELAWEFPQCVLITDHTPLFIVSKIWLDALYIRAKPSLYYPYHSLCARESSEVYGTRLTLQGAGDWNTTGAVVVGGGHAYIQGACV